jgi:hypothetical protein
MTKDELIFSVKGIIEGQAPTQDGLKFTHPQEIALQIAKAYELAVIQFFGTPEMSGDYDLDYFSKTYEGTLKETTAKELYLDLPANPIAIKGGVGIRMVRPKDSTVLISRISESEFQNMRHLEAFCCSPVPFCYADISGNRIVLQANRPEYSLMTDMVIKIIPKFDEFDDDDDINSPGGDYSITQMVLQQMGLRPTDNTNDDGR